MRIAVVHTVGAPCGCAQAVAKGLLALGHEVVFVDSAEITLRAAEIATTCDLVIDHTDTFHGSGFLRPFVRWLLETRGARIVGSDARACLRADDKLAAKTLLSGAGIPTPPGVAVTSKEQTLPSWLKAPAVLKPSFEHMSRGLHIAATLDEIPAGVTALMDRFRQPILAETFIDGREIAVSVLEDEQGLRVLPPLEWCVHDGENGVLTESFKRSNVPQDRQDALRADLSPGLAADLETFSLLAFRALGLRDYARFDVRLSPGGTFYFLEANTTPSLEPYEALALSAGWAGMDYTALVGKMLSAALRRYGQAPLQKEEKEYITLGVGPVELIVAEGVHRPPPSTLDLANLLDVRQGDRVLDLGCGSGLLAIAAAKLGAGEVVATDIDPRSLDATVANAQVNGVSGKIRIRAGSWYESLADRPGGEAERFDVIVATPPQTPAPHAIGPRYGGPDGLQHLTSVLRGAPVFLKPNRGRLWLLAISLVNMAELLQRLRARFHDVAIVRQTERSFTQDEYESIEKGLMDHLFDLRSSGRSAFRDAGEGRYIFDNFFICARGVKAT
jgi:D-alanine-D-alanine ligase